MHKIKLVFRTGKKRTMNSIDSFKLMEKTLTEQSELAVEEVKRLKKK